MKSHVNHLFIAMIFLALFSAELNAENARSEELLC